VVQDKSLGKLDLNGTTDTNIEPDRESGTLTGMTGGCKRATSEATMNPITMATLTMSYSNIISTITAPPEISNRR
jgi:hypothetical protein